MNSIEQCFEIEDQELWAECFVNMQVDARKWLDENESYFMELGQPNKYMEQQRFNFRAASHVIQVNYPQYIS